MADLPPQGGILVGSFPDGAGRRGGGWTRRPHDWDEIVGWHRAHPDGKAGYYPVTAGSVGDLRKKYPDLDFKPFAVHLRWRPKSQTDRKLPTPTKVCTLYVSLKEAGNGGLHAQIES